MPVGPAICLVALLVQDSFQMDLFKLSKNQDISNINMCTNALSCARIDLADGVLLGDSLTLPGCTANLKKVPEVEKSDEIDQEDPEFKTVEFTDGKNCTGIFTYKYSPDGQLKVAGNVEAEKDDKGSFFEIESCFSTGIRGCHIWKEVQGGEKGMMVDGSEERAQQLDRAEGKETLKTMDDLYQQGKEDNSTIVTFSMKFYYTTTFAERTDDIPLYFEQQIGLQNQIYKNGKIPIRIKLFCFEGLQMSDGLQEGAMLSYFKDNVRPSWASLRGSADAATLFVGSFGYCGLAYVNVWRSGQFFSVNARSCSQYVFPHEIGHNIGSNHHDGWKTKKDNMGTVMNGNHIPYYSDPNTIIDGEPIGNASHNTAKRWKEARFALASLGDESWGCKDVEVQIMRPKQITIITSSKYSWCSTDSYVYVSLFGPNGVSCKTPYLDNPGDDFKFGATDMYRNGKLGKECESTKFTNGITNILFEHSGDAWCLQDVEVELDNGDKYRCPRQDENLKIDGKWIKSKLGSPYGYLDDSKKECTPTKIESDTKTIKTSPKPRMLKITTGKKKECSLNSLNSSGSKIYVGLSGPNGEFCETSALEVSDLIFGAGEKKTFQASSFGDCSSRKFSDGITKMLFKHVGTNDWCFEGAEIELDNGERFGCPARENFKLANNEKRTCQTVRLNAVKPKELKILTSKRKECGMTNGSGLSFILTFPFGDSCKTSYLNNGFEAGKTNTYSTSSLGGDCSSRRFSEGLSKLEFQHSGSDDLCFGRVEIELDNGDRYGCPAGDDWSLNNDDKSSCTPVKLFSVKPERILITTSKRESWCGMNGKMSVKLFFTNGESCETPILDAPGNDFEAGDTNTFGTSLIGDCGKKSFSSHIDILRILFQHTEGDSWCFGGAVVSLDNGDRYGCPPGDEFQLKNDNKACYPTKLNAVKPKYLKLTTTGINGMEECQINNDSGLSLKLTFPFGETCETPILQNGIDDGTSTTFSASSFHDCVSRKFSDGLSSIQFKHSVNDDTCMVLGVEVELDNGDRYGCLPTKEMALNILNNKMCKPVQLHTVKQLKISTSNRDSDCGMNGGLSAKIIFKNGETCETSELKNARNEFVAGETTLLSKGSLGDCSMQSFETENTISSILFKHRGADNWCFGGVEVKFDDRVRYGCPPGDEFELVNDESKACSPTQLYAVKPRVLRITTNNVKPACGMKSGSGVSAILSFPFGDSCETPVLGNGFDTGKTNTFHLPSLGDCNARRFSNGLSSITLKHSGSDDWCFGGVEVELDNGDLFGCTSGDAKLLNNGDSTSCTPVEPYTVKLTSLAITTSSKNDDCGTDVGVLVKIVYTNGDSCQTQVLDNPGNDFEEGDTNVFESAKLGDCAKDGVSNFFGVSSIEFQLNGDDNWCLEKVEAVQDNGDRYGCPEETSIDLNGNDKKACKAVKLPDTGKSDEK